MAMHRLALTSIGAMGMLLSGRRAHSSSGTVRIGYVTDVEGDVVFWRKYIKESWVLEEGRTRSDPPALKDGCHFVFGGDSVDKGGQDLAFLKDLLSLKERYPDRVHFILGNRDINKMRFAQELCPARASDPRILTDGVYWLKHGAPNSLFEPRDLKDHDASSAAVMRAQWMLQCTMGCPDTFQLRKQELAKLQGVDEGEITDEATTQDFLRSVLPGGEMAGYLKHGKLAVQINDVLFVHGAIWNGAMGAVPHVATNARELEGELVTESPAGKVARFDTVSGWAKALNSFASKEVEAWAQGTAIDRGDGTLVGDGPWASHGGWTGDVGAALLQYGMGKLPGRVPCPGVVYANFLENGNPKALEPGVRKFLSTGGVSCVVCGHQPHGDLPVVIDHSGIRVITADTSYSNNVRWVKKSKAAGAEGDEWEEDQEAQTCLPANTKASYESGNGSRGHAVSEVCFDSCVANDGSVVSKPTIHGVLSTGEKYSFSLPIDKTGASTATPEALVGKRLKSGWWIKGLAPDGNFVLSKAEGFDVSNRKAHVSEVLEDMLHEP